MRINQFPVRGSRPGENWRGEKCRIKDAQGNLSSEITRLLATYLRQGWIKLGEQKAGEELIGYFSPKGIRYMVSKLGNEILDQFTYSRSYEETYRRYKIWRRDQNAHASYESFQYRSPSVTDRGKRLGRKNWQTRLRESLEKRRFSWLVSQDRQLQALFDSRKQQYPEGLLVGTGWGGQSMSYSSQFLGQINAMIVIREL